MGVISVTQLRSEIGGATSDTRDAGGITDTELRNIIDRHEELVETAVVARLASGGHNLTGSLVTDEAVAVTTDDGNPLVSSAEIPSEYFPWVFKATDASGNDISYDPDIFETASNNGGIFIKRRFCVFGDRIYVLPVGSATIKVIVGDYDEIVSSVAPDIVESATQTIISEARQMLQAKIVEGSRQLKLETGD